MCNGNVKDFVGSIHTHPGGLTSPSPADLRVASRTGERIACIATRYDDWDEDEKTFKRYKAVCLTQSTPIEMDVIDDYSKQSQELLQKYKDELFKMSKVGSLSTHMGINMRGDVLMPEGSHFEKSADGKSMKLVQNGTVPFLQEHDARRFDENQKEFLLVNFDEYIEEERKYDYDDDSKFVVTKRKGY
jgi:hypothetical protein